MNARGPVGAAVLVMFVACVAPGCRAAAPAGRRPLTVTSTAYTVRGEYVFVAMDRIDGLAGGDGRIVLKGAPADLAVDLPAAADPARPTRHWALVTDAHVGGRRLLTFTQSESVQDFSIDLPDGDAAIQFASFAARNGGGEVLVFAAGDRSSGPQPLFGHVAINPK
jgi:hypothetical protein